MASSDEAVCAGCGEVVATRDEPNNIRLSAMQTHDRECLAHDFNGVPCRHKGDCYEWRAALGLTAGQEGENDEG